MKQNLLIYIVLFLAINLHASENDLRENVEEECSCPQCLGTIAGRSMYCYEENLLTTWMLGGFVCAFGGAPAIFSCINGQYAAGGAYGGLYACGAAPACCGCCSKSAYEWAHDHDKHTFTRAVNAAYSAPDSWLALKECVGRCFTKLDNCFDDSTICCFGTDVDLDKKLFFEAPHHNNGDIVIPSVLEGSGN